MKQVFISARQVLDKSIYCLSIKENNKLESQTGIFHTSALRSCLFATYIIKNAEDFQFCFENQQISNYIKEKLPHLNINQDINLEVFKLNLTNIISRIDKEFKYYTNIDKSLFKTMDF